MLSDDVYRSRLQLTIASLRYWVPSIADAAHVEENEAPEFWKLAVTPKIAAACPFELILHASQHYDLMVADEVYEGRTVESVDVFLPLVEAIAAGRVIQRRWVSTTTGAVRAIETIISLGDGKQLRDGHTNESVAAAIPLDATERHDRHFLPYRR